MALDASYPVGTTTITWNVTDVIDNEAVPVAQTVTNTAPMLSVITAPKAPLQINSLVSASASIANEDNNF